MRPAPDENRRHTDNTERPGPRENVAGLPSCVQIDTAYMSICIRLPVPKAGRPGPNRIADCVPDRGADG